MLNLRDLMNPVLFAEMLEQGYVRRQVHPGLPLSILNYTEKAAYDGVWNEVTLQCRGLIHDDAGGVVARPFPKFFNHGQNGAPELLPLDAPAIVTDKLDGSLGILYPTPTGHAIATRGSFASEQALHSTELWLERYEDDALILPGLTYLFEIVYPANRIVVDYGDTDDLYLLDVLNTATGAPMRGTVKNVWLGPHVEKLSYRTLADAIAADPRPNCEGVVVYFPDTNERVKIKQEDYMVLHRILTGTNARNVWEVAAVKACAHLIREPNHWGSFLGIGPERAAECLALGDEWLAKVPDEFHEWVRATTAEADHKAWLLQCRAHEIAMEAQTLPDRRARYEYVTGQARFLIDAEQARFLNDAEAMIPSIMRMLSATTPDARRLGEAEIFLRSWREATPAPTAPFARSEDVA